MDIFVAPLVSFVSSCAGCLILVWTSKSPSQWWMSLILGACAGIMLGASFFSLIFPALQLPAAAWPYHSADVCAMFGGALLMLGIHIYTPHTHTNKGDEGFSHRREEHQQGRQRSSVHSVVLVTSAVAIHNIPEGFALGVGSQTPEAMSILWGIGLQNLPEGAIIALSIQSLAKHNRLAVVATIGAALLEALAAFAGSMVGRSSDSFSRYALMFCAGTMIYVVSQEMIPESHREGKEGIATLALIAGVVFMLALSIN